jgi:hypothetical protein
LGCRSASAAPPPAPVPAPAPPPAPPPQSPIIGDEIRICVVKDGRMSMVEGTFNPATGDTTVDGRLFHEAYPVTAAYLTQAQWYWDDKSIIFDNIRYLKYGLPRSFSSTDVVPIGSYEGVPVFADRTAVRPVEVVYLPVTPECTFQPYQVGEIGAVRG